MRFSVPLDCTEPELGGIRNCEEEVTMKAVVTARQARGIVANAFFANCWDVMEPKKGEDQKGGLDWRPLLISHTKTEGPERMRCHMLYFDATFSEQDLERRITFDRVVYKLIDFLADDNSNNNNKKDRPPVGQGIVLHSNAMESPTRPCTAFVNFANSVFGFGRFFGSCTQEEILLSCCPEIMVGMVLIGAMSDGRQ